MRDPEIMARVKAILSKVEAVAPGRSVELRIPPYAAIQCVAGTTHRRGTPPNVVEMEADTLFALFADTLKWAAGVSNGKIHASGTLSDLSKVFELVRISK
jgi:Bacterial SCP ortholog